MLLSPSTKHTLSSIDFNNMDVIKIRSNNNNDNNNTSNTNNNNNNDNSSSSYMVVGPGGEVSSSAMAHLLALHSIDCAVALREVEALPERDNIEIGNEKINGSDDTPLLASYLSAAMLAGATQLVMDAICRPLSLSRAKERLREAKSTMIKFPSILTDEGPGRMLLHLAVKSGNLLVVEESVKMLLSLDRSLCNVVDEEKGQLPIHVASLNKTLPLQVFKDLIEILPSSISKTDAMGFLPLHLAVAPPPSDNNSSNSNSNSASGGAVDEEGVDNSAVVRTLLEKGPETVSQVNQFRTSIIFLLFIGIDLSPLLYIFYYLSSAAPEVAWRFIYAAAAALLLQLYLRPWWMLCPLQCSR